MTELDAVNIILRAIGSTKVNSLSNNHPDIADARDKLSQLSAETQRKGYWFNTDYNVTFVLNENNEIAIPSTYDTIVWDDFEYSVRGGLLYDYANQTYTFDSNKVAVRTVRILDWEDLPSVMQDYVTYMATAHMVRDVLDDTAKKDDFLRDAAKALIAVERQNLLSSKHNVFHRARVLRTRAGVRPSRISNNSWWYN